MKVIKPIEIIPNKVISSTAIEQYNKWSSSTTYTIGNRSIYQDVVYESVVTDNLNKQPNLHPKSWLLIGPDNKMSMFDNQVNTQTTATESLTVVFQPGKSFNTVAFLNIVGSVISVVVKDGIGGNVLYSSSTNLDSSFVTVMDWYTYFFEDFDFRTEAVFHNIPPYNSGVVEVTITAPSGHLVAIGSCSVGTVIDIGSTQYGLNYGIRDYSLNKTDEFGNTEFVERAFSKRMSMTLFIPNSRLNYVTNTLQSLRAIPTVYIGVDDTQYQGTIVFGFLKDWNIEIAYPNHSLISAEVNGLI